MKYVPTVISVDPDIISSEVMLAWQVQLPVLAALTETVLTYVVVFTITAGTGSVGINITSAGPVHSVLTVTGTSTAGLNSTVQVRVTLAPAITPSGAVIVTAVGAGTEGRENYKKILQMNMKNYN